MVVIRLVVGVALEEARLAFALWVAEILELVLVEVAFCLQSLEALLQAPVHRL